MRTPVNPEQDGHGEERKEAGLITARLIDSTMRWLPIQGYEEDGKVTTSKKLMGKEL
jgi:hypothetical protein